MRNKTRLRFGFKGQHQIPLFMIWREYIENDEVVFAEVLVSIG